MHSIVVHEIDSESTDSQFCERQHEKIANISLYGVLKEGASCLVHKQRSLVNTEYQKIIGYTIFYTSLHYIVHYIVMF